MKTILLTIAFIVSAVLSGAASEKPKFYGEITAVDAKAKTVTIYEGPNKSVTYAITDKTQLVVNDKPGSLGELKSGMKVSVSHKTDSTDADFITAETTKKPRRR